MYVHHLLADQTVYVGKLTVKLSAHVYLALSELLHHVALNVLSVLNVLLTKLVRIKNVEIRAQVLVELVLFAKWLITTRYVVVPQAILVIRSSDVIQLQVK